MAQQSTLRTLPAEVVDQIIMFVTDGEAPMPALVKAFRGSSADQDLYSNCLYRYYSRNVMHVTRENLEDISLLSEQTVNSIYHLCLHYNVHLWIRDIAYAELYGPGAITEVITLDLEWTFLHRFSRLETLEIDVMDIPVDRLKHVDSAFIDCKTLPSMKRITLKIGGKMSLPIPFITEYLNDDTIDAGDRLKMWEEHVIEAYFFNLGKVRMQCNQHFIDKSYADMINGFFPGYRDLFFRPPQMLVGMSNRFNNTFDELFHAPFNTFIEGLNEIMRVRGKLVTPSWGNDFTQEWFWDLETDYEQDAIRFTRGLDAIEILDD